MSQVLIIVRRNISARLSDPVPADRPPALTDSYGPVAVNIDRQGHPSAAQAFGLAGSHD
jgi:hypothetical protein